MKLYQDVAGTVPATQPGHPVGLVVSQAGRINPSQPTALSKPTLARWPMVGVRNLAVGAQAVGNPSYWPSSVTSGVSRDVVGFGVEDGVPFIDYRFHGTPTVSAITLYTAQNSSVPLVVGERFAARVEGRVLAGTPPTANGARISVREGTGQGTGTTNTANGNPMASGSYVISEATREATGTGSTTWIYATVSISMEVGVPVDVTYRFRGLQFERGYAQTPLQFNYGPNDITEPGVKDLWHLYNDGGDSLNAVYPAGTYGVGYLSTDLVPTFTTVVSDGVTGISSLFTERQADVVIRPGEFTQADKDKITESWGRI